MTPERRALLLAVRRVIYRLLKVQHTKAGAVARALEREGLLRAEDK